jgi:hypothetical protein
MADVPPDCEPSHTQTLSDRALALVGLPPTDDFLNVHAAELPITHAAPSFWDAMVHNGAAGGLLVLKIDWSIGAGETVRHAGYRC